MAVAALLQEGVAATPSADPATAGWRPSKTRDTAAAGFRPTLTIRTGTSHGMRRQDRAVGTVPQR